MAYKYRQALEALGRMSGVELYDESHKQHTGQPSILRIVSMPDVLMYL